MTGDGHQSQPPARPESQPPAAPSILPEFVLLPGVFDKALLEDNPVCQLALKELLRALCENGLLSSVPRDKLKREIDQKIGLLPEWYRGELMEYLSRMKDRGRIVFRKGARNPPENSEAWWMQRVIESDLVEPFACITCGDNETCHMGDGDERFTTLEQLPNTASWSNVQRVWQETIHHCHQDYKAALEPMLRFAQKVDIVDPFLHPFDDNKKGFLRLVSSLLLRELESEPSPGRVHIHVGIKPREYMSELEKHGSKTTISEFAVSSWSKFLKELSKDFPHRYLLILWETQPDGTLFHDRLIMTNQGCGISSPQSFELLPDETLRDTNWTLLETSVCLKHRLRYRVNEIVFKRLEDSLVFEQGVFKRN